MADGFDFDFTQDKLAAIIPGNPYVDHWYEALCKILPDYDINTVPRVAAFLAQTAHESGGYKALKENLNYRPETLMKVFPKYFPNADIANQYAHNQEAIANRVYANRMGNSDEASGDGFRYCGRGLIQLTGKQNYSKFAESIETPVEELPEFLATFEGAIQSGCWFWETNGLNQYADAGDILTMTKRINGGTIGLEDRTNHYNHAIQVLSA
ncbi:COG3179 Predicted chitinase [uncultured Caudovirales phage]|uniref:COG3179 Predicted chitinase n=1 Tax=uncultured Caudovirales phage TaxID=2100421 RepID=A0A6J7WDL4_9CAUD|nr:COG3179 Predicted chitinase [uncultured Caudovirales phage]CAB5208946.1 COG3179 Predicted chitinase [uncultured Caudovirales phage]